MEIGEFLKDTGIMYEKLISLLDDDDYEIDDEQMCSLLDILEFFVDMCEVCTGEVDACELVPRIQHGGVTARFYVLSLAGNDITRFCKVLSKASAISFDAELDGKICVSVTVPYVFKRKS